jgi:hypothetical protein
MDAKRRSCGWISSWYRVVGVVVFEGLVGEITDPVSAARYYVI